MATWSPGSQLAIMGYPLPGAGFYTLFEALPRIVRVKIVKQILSFDQKQQVINGHDPQEPRAQQPNHHPFNMATRGQENWVYYPFISLTSQTFVRSTDRAYQNFLEVLFKTKRLIFFSVRHMANFFQHIRAFATARHRAPHALFTYIREIYLLQLRGPIKYVDAALELLEDCTRLDILRVYYCATCLNRRNGPGPRNPMRVVRRWRNLQWNHRSGRDHPPHSVEAQRGDIWWICRPCHLITVKKHWTKAVLPRAGPIHLVQADPLARPQINDDFLRPWMNDIAPGNLDASWLT